MMPMAITEAELCADLIRVAKLHGWIVYPETCNGVQVGIEAKLRGNLKVLSQAIGPPHYPGPAYHVVLVPDCSQDFLIVARQCKLFVLLAQDLEYLSAERDPFMFIQHAGLWKWEHEEPLALPDLIPDTTAGVPSPRVLTDWKMCVLALMALCEVRGYVTTADFREHGVSIGFWRHRLVDLGFGADRRKRYRFEASYEKIDPRADHPRNYAEILQRQKERKAATKEKGD
jgi:hypothetical protein